MFTEVVTENVFLPVPFQVFFSNFTDEKCIRSVILDQYLIRQRLSKMLQLIFVGTLETNIIIF